MCDVYVEKYLKLFYLIDGSINQMLGSPGRELLDDLC